jgi:T5orf172 domain
MDATDIDARDARQAPRNGQAFVYVLPCRNEDLLKLGFSRDPLERMQTLHRRYFDFFDIERGLLIQTDTVRDARALERMLAAQVQAHNASAPIVVPRSAAGHTEWYRGAYAVLLNASEQLRSDNGYLIHVPLRDWLHGRLQQRADLLFDWSQRMLDAIRHGELSGAVLETAAFAQTLQQILQAYDAVGIALEPLVSKAVIDWHRAE